jgi:EAL domain-containing protein (putative c-di-GMP-specific phosphodiesterase class I)
MGAQAVRLSNVDINNALENKDFEVLFQPIFDLGNGALARMETFVRWRHPTLGVLPPGAFISFFESQGRMGELTRYILDVALDSYVEWRGPYAPGFSINLALADLTDEAFGPHFTKLLRDRDFPADLVTLECPMPAVDSDIENMTDCFERLRATGARLAIEVRGRANDFLRTVDPFPFDEIKTGGSSILRFARTVRGPGLSAISDLLDIAGKANAVTTAVGVEDQASLSALKGLGFTAAQGNHLAKVGDLKDFRPSRVNSVRELLDLAPLSGEDLSALFRTAAPTPKASEAGAEKQAPQQAAADLAEDDAEIATDGGDARSEASGQEKSDADQKALAARARKKARAIALAKRAKARDARKAAAIKRAKAKVALARTVEEPPQDVETAAHAEAVEKDAIAARDLQDRLSQEFGGSSDGDPIVEDDEHLATGEINASIVEEESDAPVDADVALESVAPQERHAPEQSETSAAVEQEGDGAAAKDVRPDVAADSNDAPIRLAIGGARAYFRPGIRVGGAPTSIGEESAATNAQPPVPSEASATGIAPEAYEPAKFEPVSPKSPQAEAEDATAREKKSDVAETDMRPPPDERGKQVDDPPQDEDDASPSQGTLFSSDETELGAPAQIKARNANKNFLTRRYKVVPTHFWPKAWKRAWTRRAMSNEIDV